MATITAQNIIDKAEIILQDTTNTRWPEDELLGWLNDGQREIVLNKPDANPTNESVALTAGTKQSIPTSGMQLLKVVRNMGTDGSTVGRAITLIDQRILDEQRSDWHTETQVAAIKHYSFDERDPRHFYVYPPADGTSQIELVYASAPADLDIGDTISIDDIYANALLDYVLYRAYAKDADYAVNNQRVLSAYKSFLSSLGKREQIETRDSPVMQPIVVPGTVQSGGQG